MNILYQSMGRLFTVTTLERYKGISLVFIARINHYGKFTALDKLISIALLLTYQIN